MDKTKVLIVIVLIFSIASVSNALNIVYVDVSGPNNPGTGGFDDPFRKVQDAIDDANNGDVVEIRPGLYTGEGNYALDPNGKSVTIRSIAPEDPNIVANTIIDPNGAGRGFYFHSGEDSNCMVLGLTIRNAYANGSGAGIHCDNSSPSIVNCIIKDNFAEVFGGGVNCNDSNSQITNCIISNNRGRYGGGLGCFGPSNLTITNCTIVRNNVIFSGGGVFCDMSSHAMISNSILWGNELDYPEEEYGPQVCLFDGSSVSISYTAIEDGLEGVDSIASTLSWLSGNISTDPCFACFDANGDRNLWDFHLQSIYGRWDTGFYRIDFDNDGIVNLLDFARLAGVWLKNGDNLPEDLNRNGTVDWADLQIFTEYYLTNGYGGEWVSDDVTSPCIDAGDPNSGWSGEPWPNGKRVNMGAYGGTNQASMNGNIADFDVDGAVNFVDFAEFCNKWLAQEACIEDLTDNGVVDFADLGEFADNWLWQKE